jgi:predicted RNase H-like HicB family nuclease
LSISKQAIEGCRTLFSTETPWRRIVQDTLRRGKAMRYKIVLEESEEGFAVSVPALPGCHSQGATEQEAVENIADAIQEYLAAIDDRLRRASVREVEIEV